MSVGKSLLRQPIPPLLRLRLPVPQMFLRDRCLNVPRSQEYLLSFPRDSDTQLRILPEFLRIESVSCGELTNRHLFDRIIQLLPLLQVFVSNQAVILRRFSFQPDPLPLTCLD
ncbi:hypothetical protein D3C85_1503960 [compost metagenome]